MQSQAASSSDAPNPRAERRLQVLDEMMEAGRRLALAIVAQATEVDAPRVVEGDLALAFSRANRAVRMAILVQAELEKGGQETGEQGGADGGKPGKPSVPRELRVFLVEPDGTERPMPSHGGPHPADPAAPPPFKSTGAVADIVRRVAKATLLPGELSPRDERETIERYARETVERLEREDDFDTLMRRPLSEILAHICRDLGFTPDWTVLAQEAWAEQELASGRVGAPLARFAGRDSLPLDGGGAGVGVAVTLGQPAAPRHPPP